MIVHLEHSNLFIVGQSRTHPRVINLSYNYTLQLLFAHEYINTNIYRFALISKTK